jgi:hypothetical protein
MANSYKTVMVEVSTTGTDIPVFTAPSGHSIVRNVMIYAKGSGTVVVKYDDRTTNAAINKATLTTDELWEPFSTPLGMLSANVINVNTAVAVNVLVTYVEFT